MDQCCVGFGGVGRTHKVNVLLLLSEGGSRDPHSIGCWDLDKGVGERSPSTVFGYETKLRRAKSRVWVP